MTYCAAALAKPGEISLLGVSEKPGQEAQITVQSIGHSERITGDSLCGTSADLHRNAYAPTCANLPKMQNQRLSSPVFCVLITDAPVGSEAVVVFAAVLQENPAPVSSCGVAPSQPC